MDKVIAIVGPTASGKSALAIEAARRLNGEIISADSMQVYRDMNIGTAKVMPSEMEGIPHHLIDIQDYQTPWNVKIFQDACRKAIADITGRGKIPILCGGTGLYVKAALYDYQFEEETEDPVLEQEIKSLSNTQLLEALNKEDPQALEKIHPNNIKRLQRALYIARKGTAKSEREAVQKHEPVYDLYLVGLYSDRQEEMKRIEKRVDQMMEAGLPEEVRGLFQDPNTRQATSFQGIGYKEFDAWLDGSDTLDHVKERIVINTRQYARRQMTWFRNQMPVHWYPVEEKEKILSDLEDWYGR